MHKITTAVIQMESLLNEKVKNLETATQLVESAAKKGATLILLPELMPGGYCLTEEIWNSAELFDGSITQWLKELSKSHDAYIGTSFLEVDHEDFYNTFVLANPDGEIAGRVRKNPPASFEAYFYRAGDDEHYIDTEIGRIGVAICYENALYEYYSYMCENNIDIWLKPFSGGSFEAKFPITHKDVELINESLKGGTQEVAEKMGIPVLMANKVGRLVTEVPAGFPPQNIEFPGFSAIADSDGRLLDQLDTGIQGVGIGEVTVSEKRKIKVKQPKKYGRWAGPLPWWAPIWPMTQWMGEKAYRKNQRRREKAIELVTASARKA